MTQPSDNSLSETYNHRFAFAPNGLESAKSYLNLHFLGFIHDHTGEILRVHPEAIDIDLASFQIHDQGSLHQVTVVQNQHRIELFCDCDSTSSRLCVHEAKALAAIFRNEDFLIFFDAKLRFNQLKQTAKLYGLENETDLDSYFQVRYSQFQLSILPVEKGLIPLSKESLQAMEQKVVPESDSPSELNKPNPEDCFILIKQHKYYKHLQLEICLSPRTKEGKIKNPVNALNIQDFIWNLTNPDELKFMVAVDRFRSKAEADIAEADLIALKALVKNPLSYPFFVHDAEISENLVANAISEIHLGETHCEFALHVNQGKGVYELSLQIKIDNKQYEFKDFEVKYAYFLKMGNQLFLIDSLPVLKLIHILKEKASNLIVHASKFKTFKAEFLDKIDEKIKVEYQHIPVANTKQLTRYGFVDDLEQLVYLSDFGRYVMIIPVMRYSDVEVSIRSHRQVYGVDDRGKQFLVKRDTEREIAFLSTLVKQHPEFREQLENPLQYLYLHKRDFLDENWFLNAFEAWRESGITILGFNQLKNNKINPFKGKIDIKVLSGQNWFNVDVNVSYGKKHASIKKVHVAVKNKSKYVQLDDGTYGILPEEWIEKFAEYFQEGEIFDDENLIIPKVNFTAIDRLFEAQMLDEPAFEEVQLYRSKMENFSSIENIDVPAELKGELRPYQREGLNWLNFLDNFNFGGCLADDMGLGKSIQIIAFMLLQSQKVEQNTNLLVVPTTLIFNWKAEIKKFAPNLKVLTLQGPDRTKDSDEFSKNEVVLISYNTLITDINYLKKFTFNYIFLDESQQIKNPESQRYKAARLLKARNRIAITGTPVENNTFDLYSQFSFACPGLLGSKQRFKFLYSVPIDKFKSSNNARDLQQKVSPFLLRRTKQQVAQELPEKTEQVLYCEMGKEQRKVYDAYEKEFREYISATADEEIEKHPMNALKGLTKLRQICNSAKLLKAEDLSTEETSSKIQSLLEQIETNAEHHKMLVFSQFVSMLDLIQTELNQRNIKYVVLTGSTKNREEVVARFQNDPEIKVFLISLKAGGTGLNLTEADYVYLVDPWWNPAVENQAIDRAHRIGQQKNVTAIRMICPNTVEEKIMQLQSHKKDLVDKLIIDEPTFLSSFTKVELLKLLN